MRMRSKEPSIVPEGGGGIPKFLRIPVLFAAPRILPLLRDHRLRIAALTETPVFICACRLQTDRSTEVPRGAEFPSYDQTSSLREPARLSLSQVRPCLPHFRRHEPTLPARMRRHATLQVSALRNA